MRMIVIFLHKIPHKLEMTLFYIISKNSSINKIIREARIIITIIYLLTNRTTKMTEVYKEKINIKIHNFNIKTSKIKEGKKHLQEEMISMIKTWIHWVTQSLVKLRILLNPRKPIIILWMMILCLKNNKIMEAISPWIHSKNSKLMIGIKASKWIMKKEVPILEMDSKFLTN